MKLLLSAFLMVLLLSSCLKQSIADALIVDANGNAPGVATMSYVINGKPVTLSVSDPDSQSPTGYQLGCTKSLYPGGNIHMYSFDGVSSSGEMSFTFVTDSLTVGHYVYNGDYGGLFVTSYNGTNDFIYAPGDSISFNISSYSRGHISGNFSGRLTPLIDDSNPVSIYGTPGSVLITNGIFKDVPVFY